MIETIRGRRSQGGIIIAVIAGILILLYWLSPTTVVVIGRAIGGILAWLITNTIGAVSSIITGLVSGIGG